MNNIELFEQLWSDTGNMMRQIWNRDLDDQHIENLIFEMRDNFINTSQIITGEIYTPDDLRRVNELVSAFLRN